MIGAVAGVVVVYGVDLLEYLRIDDPIGAVAVHMLAGIWGTLSLGLFATGSYGLPTPNGPDTTTAGNIVKGLFYGGNADVLKAQFVGSAACMIFVGGAAWIIFKLVNMTGWLRVEPEGELEGLDLFEHGTAAYHMEFGQGMTYTTPAGGFPGGTLIGAVKKEEPVSGS
jgi:Amt family ammonium transporter